MRLPRARFTVRRMMVAVAVAALALAWGSLVGRRWWDNWTKCRILIAYYARMEAPARLRLAQAEAMPQGTEEERRIRRALASIHREQAERLAAVRRKYESMRWRPWLKVPDVEPGSPPPRSGSEPDPVAPAPHPPEPE